MTQPPQWSDPTSSPSGDQPAPSAGPHPPEGAIPAQPLYPGASYGTPPGHPYGAGYAPQPYPYQPPRRTNGLAVASMVVSLVGAVGLCGYGLGGYIGAVGAILGHVARRQVAERGEEGDGMALSGIIVGWIATGLAVVATILIALFVFAIINTPGFTEPPDSF